MSEKNSIKKENESKVYICENCGKKHDGSYGSGRFCSKSCKCAFNAKKNHWSELRTTLKGGGFLFSLQRLNLHNQLTSNRLCSD